MEKLGFRRDFDYNNRIVKQEDLLINGKEYFISTVDLGIDHGFGGSPLYFETMIFPKGEYSEMYGDRYETRKQALISHERLVEEIKNGEYIITEGYFNKK